MNFWAYMLRCADGSYYTGHTEDLDKRVCEHQAGTYRGYTFTRRPVELVWSEVFGARRDALETEHKLKSWSRAKKEALIGENWGRLSRMAVPPRERSARSKKGLDFARHSPSSSLGKADEGRLQLAPTIILVRPQLGENIGKAARAMLNFGLTDLRLVAPRDGWPNPDAGPAAAGADIVLAQARVFETIAAATADCAHVYATTVRRRGVVKPVMTPEQAASAIHATTGRSAILFGPERAGLETEDVAVARTVLTVPINPQFGSLNLAQAVILVAYEWSKHVALASPTVLDLDPPAPQQELDELIGQLDRLLEEAHYFWPPDRNAVTRNTLRSVLTKPGWSHKEIRTLRGVLGALQGRKRAKT